MINDEMSLDRLPFLPQYRVLREEIQKVCDQVDAISWGDKTVAIHDADHGDSVVQISKPSHGTCRKEDLRFRVGKRVMNYQGLVDEVGEIRWGDTTRPSLKVMSILDGRSFHAYYTDDGYGFSIKLSMDDQDSDHAEYAWSLINPSANPHPKLDQILGTFEDKVGAILYICSSATPNCPVPRGKILDILRDKFGILCPDSELQPKKIESDRIVHNGGRQANAALQLTNSGVQWIRQKIGPYTDFVQNSLISTPSSTPPRKSGKETKRPPEPREQNESQDESQEADKNPKRARPGEGASSSTMKFQLVLDLLHGQDAG